MKRFASILLTIGALAGCTSLETVQRPAEETMMTLAAALAKVSAAAEAMLRYGDSTITLTDTEFLNQSVAHDPALLVPFADYQILSERQTAHVDLLVCSKDGRVALLEDAGCTAAIDSHRWREIPMTACVFQLDLVRVCPAAN